MARTTHGRHIQGTNPDGDPQLPGCSGIGHCEPCTREARVAFLVLEEIRGAVLYQVISSMTRCGIGIAQAAKAIEAMDAAGIYFLMRGENAT